MRKSNKICIFGNVEIIYLNVCTYVDILAFFSDNLQVSNSDILSTNRMGFTQSLNIKCVLQMNTLLLNRNMCSLNVYSVVQMNIRRLKWIFRATWCHKPGTKEPLSCKLQTSIKQLPKLIEYFNHKISTKHLFQDFLHMAFLSAYHWRI